MSIYSNIPSGAFFGQVEIVIRAASSDDAGTLASPVVLELSSWPTALVSVFLQTSR